MHYSIDALGVAGLLHENLTQKEEEEAQEVRDWQRAMMAASPNLHEPVAPVQRDGYQDGEVEPVQPQPQHSSAPTVGTVAGVASGAADCKQQQMQLAQEEQLGDQRQQEEEEEEEEDSMRATQRVRRGLTGRLGQMRRRAAMRDARTAADAAASAQFESAAGDEIEKAMIGNEEGQEQEEVDGLQAARAISPAQLRELCNAAEQEGLDPQRLMAEAMALGALAQGWWAAVKRQFVLAGKRSPRLCCTVIE
jgi:hypothetical protein